MIIDRSYVPKRPYVPLSDPNSKESAEACRAASRKRNAKRKAAQLRRNSGPSFTGTYREYLASDVWAKKRRMRLAEDNNKCIVCQENADQVHHWCYTYPYGKERDYQLAGMCGRCHKYTHKKYDIVSNKLKGLRARECKLEIQHLINMMRQALLEA